jgi:hypothetical protein
LRRHQLRLAGKRFTVLGKYGKGEREPFAFSLLVREARRIARKRQKDQIPVVSLRTLISLAAMVLNLLS